MGSGLVERDRVPGGIRLSPAPGAAEALIQLINLERECCAWIDFAVSEGSVATLTADADGEVVLAGMFQATNQLSAVSEKLGELVSGAALWAFRPLSGRGPGRPVAWAHRAA